MTIKPRTLIKDRKPTKEEMEVVTDFVLNHLSNEIDGGLAMIAVAILREDRELIYATMVSIMAATIHTWEISDEVDLSDELFKFLGEQNGD